MSIFVCLRPVVNRPHSLAFDEMADSGVNSLSVCSLSSLRSFARLPLSHSWTHESEPHFVWLIASVSDFHWKSIPVVLPRKSSWLLTSLDVLLLMFCYDSHMENNYQRRDPHFVSRPAPDGRENVDRLETAPLPQILSSSI